MRLAWLTDIHLDQVTDLEVRWLAARARAVSDACVITGDISNAAKLSDDLLMFARHYEGTVHFVLGNHDYYGSTFLTVNERMVELDRRTRMTWLERSSPVVLTEETELCGIGGWYDAEYGHGMQSQVQLNDFAAIYDLKMACLARRLYSKLRALAKAAADDAEAQLRRTRAREVIFATHVPPFPENSVYAGKQSDDHFLPYFTSKAMGDMLLRVAASLPHQRFTVLCGHSHGRATHQPLPNLVCHTGAAEYGSPEVERVFEV